MLDDDDRGDMEFSDDEGMLPDKPTFLGLFRPSLFKSLLPLSNVGPFSGSPSTHVTPLRTFGVHQSSASYS